MIDKCEADFMLYKLVECSRKIDDWTQPEPVDWHRILEYRCVDVLRTLGPFVYRQALARMNNGYEVSALNEMMANPRYGKGHPYWQEVWES